MNVASIKELVNSASLADLREAEEAILNEESPKIEVPGVDEGEQLTHAMAAIWIKEYMEKNEVAYPKALREYTLKVRNSIS